MCYLECDASGGHPVYVVAWDLGVLEPIPYIETILVLGGLAVVAAAVASGVVRGNLRRPKEKCQRTRTGRKLDGYASPKQLRDKLSPRAARKHGKVTRPGLDMAAVKSGGETATGIRLGYQRDLWSKLPATGYAGFRPSLPGLTKPAVVAALDENVLLLAVTQMGKTSMMVVPIWDFPGPAVVTSTSPDVYTRTAALRGQRGRVHKFNPDGLGPESGPDRITSTFRWSPIPGCEDPRLAVNRAGSILYAVDTSAVKNEDFWKGSAVRMLRAFLHAAALSGKTMADVAAWANSMRDQTAVKILASDPRAADGWAGDLAGLLESEAGATRDSMAMTLQLALGFMADPNVAAACMPAPGEQFDVEAFLTSGADTLYLLGEDKKHGSVAPLFTCFMDHLHATAKKLASRRAAERLDPPVGYFLDEVANICPIPLEQWTSDSLKRGITIMAAAQSRSQLRARYGNDHFSTIWNNFTVKLIWGGFSDEEDLEAISRMCGEVDVVSVSTSGEATDSNPKRSKSIHRRRVLTPEQVASPPDGAVICKHRATPAVLLHPVDWKTPANRRRLAAARETAQAPAPAPARATVEDVR